MAGIHRKSVIILLLTILALPGLAHAVWVHQFDCKQCHRPGVSATALGDGKQNICLRCHTSSGVSVTLNDGTTNARPNGLFASGDASNAMGNNPAPADETSHMWAASDAQPEAGASAPVDSSFYGRYGITTGKVACSRCHNPHDHDTNPKLLKLGAGSREAMCLDCHRDWNQAGNHGLETHPLPADYEAIYTANPTKYRAPADVAAAAGEVQLVDPDADGTFGVSCSSCHGVHYTDSDAATTDGVGQTLNPGDGKLLRADGAQGDTSMLCQACHTYKVHGSATETAGCLVCHSGHVYSASQTNYFVLRKETSTTTYNSVTGLNYTALPDVWGGASTTAEQWAGTAGMADGYCERCHGELTSMPNSSRLHVEGENCLGCHEHNRSGGTYSFEANCTDCHGFPPQDLTQGGPNGYAFVSGTRDYSADADYKPEDSTPHARHAAPSGNYVFSCSDCHDDDFGATHNDGDYRNVFTGATPSTLSSGGGNMTPAYSNATGGGVGNCSNLYCHSNGGKRTGDGTRSYLNAPAAPQWKSGAGTITTCDACHGNDATDMSGHNSDAHLVHLNKGYACNVCHEQTASSATALVGGAAGGAHVDGDVDISFDTAYNLGADTLGGGSYGAVAGTCSIYCHSDGAGNNATPDWDVAASGDCGTCHSVTPSSGSHTRHIDANGANIGCASCHGAGADTGSHSGHVDGGTSVNSSVCDTCHAVDGADGSTTPTWGNAATADCRACHAGSSFTSYTDAGSVARTAPNKSAYFSAGHGKTTVIGGGTAPNQACTGCHETAYTADHMDSQGANVVTKRLKTVNGQTYSAASPNAFCGACHDGGSGDETAHFATGGTSDDGTKCNFCHDPHGIVNYDAMVKSTIQSRAVATFSDRTARASYANASYTGVCQVCHSSDVAHFNRSTYESGHGGAQNCLACHEHKLDTGFDVTCYGCHGGGSVGTTSGKKNFWPDGSTAHTANQGGEHQGHMLKIAERMNAAWTTVDALLNGATDTQQKQMCEYCHAAVTNDDDHLSSSEAEVFATTVGGSAARFAKKIWDGTDDPDATYNPDKSCSSTDCHNNQTTPAGYTWYAGGSSRCEMCHITDLPTTGDHLNHLNTSSIYYSSGRIGCPDCHSNTTATSWSGNTPPSSGHIDGTFSIGGSRSLSYTGTYPSTKGTCGTNSCHNDGKGGAPNVAYTWDNGSTNSLNSCVSCHTNNAEGHASHAAAEGSIVTANYFGDCDKCHLDWISSTHFDGTVNINGAITYSGTTAVGDGNFGTCTTTVCHQDGRGTAVTTPMWNRTPASGDECRLCHDDLPTTGSHGDHVQTAATSYTTAAATNSTQTDYDFNCANCHGATLSNHLDTQRDVVGQGWDGFKCAASVCHSNGDDTPVYTDSPNWSGGTFSGDKCAGCHLNSPDTGAHHEHEVGFHYDAVYSGLTGFLPVNDADPYDAGLDDTVFDQLRGHGGNLGGGTGTSTSTTITCYVCHYDTVRNWFNAKNTTCAGCHTAVDNPTTGDMQAGNAALSIHDKSKHVNGTREVVFFNRTVRSKAQLRDDLADVTEISNNWNRVGGYKAADGSSYDEQPDTLDNLGTWNSADKTCQISCHLWEDNRVDKYPANWDSGSMMCIDCHTRLPM